MVILKTLKYVSMKTIALSITERTPLNSTRDSTTTGTSTLVADGIESQVLPNEGAIVPLPIPCIIAGCMIATLALCISMNDQSKCSSWIVFCDSLSNSPTSCVIRDVKLDDSRRYVSDAHEIGHERPVYAMVPQTRYNCNDTIFGTIDAIVDEISMTQPVLSIAARRRVEDEWNEWKQHHRVIGEHVQCLVNRHMFVPDRERQQGIVRIEHPLRTPTWDRVYCNDCQENMSVACRFVWIAEFVIPACVLMIALSLCCLCVSNSWIAIVSKT